jgi:hypothetical protein
MSHLQHPHVYAGGVNAGAAMLDERDRNAAKTIGPAPEPSLLGAVVNEVASLTNLAYILRDRSEGQRRRLLGDIPPSPEEGVGALTAANRTSVSFVDIAEALQRLRAVMSDIDAHTAALVKIG